MCHPVIYLMAAAEAQIAQKQFIVDLTKFLWKTAVVSKNKYPKVQINKLAFSGRRLKIKKTLT